MDWGHPMHLGAPSPCSSSSTMAMELSQVLAEYVWLGPGGTLRSKTRVLEAGLPACVEDLPVMVVGSEEGSSHHGQSAESFTATDVVLRPRKLFKDPFRGGDNVLVLCDPFLAPQVDLCTPATPEPQPMPALKPHPSNMRVPCEELMAQAQQEQPMFAVEQEYWVDQGDEYLLPQEEAPGSWPHAHLPDPCKPHLYGPAGEVTQTIPAVRGASMARAAAARKLSEVHLHCCLKAGLKVTSCGEGGQAGMWSYKLGPMPGTELGDQLWMSRHLLIRLAEAMCVPLTFDAATAGRPINCFFKYSTLSSRRPDIGLSVLQQHLGRLQASHVQHMLAYGLTKSPDPAAAAAAAAALPACAVCSSSAPLCLPVSTALHRCGHLVDRRPTGNADPWVVAMRLVATTLHVTSPTTSPTPAANMACAPAAPAPHSNGSCDSQQMAMAAEAMVNAIHAAQVAAYASALNGAAMCQGHALQQQVVQVGCMAVRPSLVAQQLLFEAAAQQGGCSDDEEGISGDSWGCDSVPESASLCTEDVLLQELDRMDGLLPEEPMHTASGAASRCESCCSDGTSPETEADDACSEPHTCTQAPPKSQTASKPTLRCSKRARCGAERTHNTSGWEGSFSCAGPHHVPGPAQLAHA